MYCCNCGKKLGEEDRFCDACGTPVYEEKSTPVGDPECVPEEKEVKASGDAGPGVMDEKGKEVSGETEESGQDPTVKLPEEGAALSDLEKRIMKNMEDELILEAPYGGAKEQPLYGGNQGQRGQGHPPYGGGVAFDGSKPPYGNGQFPPYPGGPGQPYGQPFGTDGREFSEKTPKKKKVLVISLSCIVALLLIAIVVFVFLILSPENKLKECIKDRDWVAVSKLYEERFAGEEKKEKKAGEIFRETIDALKEEFIAGTMDYSTVKRHLKAIEDFWDDDYVKNALDFVRELGDSRSAFEEAEQHMQQEEYEEAIRLYGEVSESDSNYEVAVEKLKTAKERYKEKIFGEAGAYEEIKDYDSAIAVLEAGLEVLSDDIEIGSRLEELQKAQEAYGIEAVLEKAKSHASGNNYFEAMTVVKAGVEENPGNDKLEAALKDYSEKYKKDILAKAEAAIGNNENYEAAILIFDSALRTLGGDYAEVEQAIREKREEYVRLQLEKSERENIESAIVGVWKGTMVSSEGIDIPMDQFLAYAGLPDTNATINCQPSGALHFELFGETGDGTWHKEKSASGAYYLEIEGDTQAVQIDNSGRLRMDLNGILLIFEKTGEA